MDKNKYREGEQYEVMVLLQYYKLMMDSCKVMCVLIGLGTHHGE